MIIQYSLTMQQKLTAAQHTLSFVGTVPQTIKDIAWDAVESEKVVLRNIEVMRIRYKLKSLLIRLTDQVGKDGNLLMGVSMDVRDLRTFKSKLNKLKQVRPPLEV